MMLVILGEDKNEVGRGVIYMHQEEKAPWTLDWTLQYALYRKQLLKPESCNKFMPLSKIEIKFTGFRLDEVLKYKPGLRIYFTHILKSSHILKYACCSVFFQGRSFETVKNIHNEQTASQTKND